MSTEDEEQYDEEGEKGADDDEEKGDNDKDQKNRKTEMDQKNKKDEKDEIGEKEKKGSKAPGGEFEFFLELAKPLILELPSSEDRSMAALWLKKLEATSGSEEMQRLRTDYLKLLVFVMQRGNLVDPFKNEPPDNIEGIFPKEYELTEMGNLLLEKSEGGGSRHPKAAGKSYSVETSNDLKEFVAAQEIPDFGVQVYYAWSAEEPVHKWSSFDETKFPHYVREKIKQLKVINSEVKTNVQAGTQGENCPPHPYDSLTYDKNRLKVKSPQEIERILERRSRHSLSSSASQGICKDDDAEKSSGKKSRTGSRKAGSETSARKVASGAAGSFNKGFLDSDEEGFDSGRGRKVRAKDEYGGQQQANRKQSSATSKRLQFESP